MKISIVWDDPDQTIIYCSYEGEWVLEEYLAALNQGVRLMRSVDHPVDVIVYTVDAAAQSPPLWALRAWRYAVMNQPSNAGMTVSVPGNASVRAFSFALNRLLGSHFQGKLLTANTVDQARQLIRQARNP